MSVLRKLLFLTLPTLLLCFIVAELLFRFVVPAAELPYTVFDPRFGIMKLDTGGPRNGLFTLGPFLEGRGRWRVNDEGWNSDVEYRRSFRRPLIAVIGDSFVEGVHVDAGQNFGAVLRKRLRGRAEVYTFGYSGTPLSGYLQLARYVRHELKPDILVVNLVYNDFEQSVRSLQKIPYFLQFERRGKELVEIPAEGYRAGSLIRVLRHSAVARYVLINCRLERNLAWLRNDSRRHAARLLRERREIEPVIATIFARLRAENPQTAVVILMDGPRQPIYADPLSQRELRWLPSTTRRLAVTNGFIFIDLGSRLRSWTATTGQPIAFASDYHWNSNGHRVAADVLMEQLHEHRLVR